MNDFWSFRKMITPVIIHIIFWIGVGLSVIIGLMAIVQGATADYGGGSKVLSGFVTLIVGPLATRIYCEVLILLFRINETLTEIRNDRRGEGIR